MLPRKLSKVTWTNIGRSVGRQAQTVPSEVSIKDQYTAGAAESMVLMSKESYNCTNRLTSCVCRRRAGNNEEHYCSSDAGSNDTAV